MCTEVSEVQWEQKLCIQAHLCLSMTLKHMFVYCPWTSKPRIWRPYHNGCCFLQNTSKQVTPPFTIEWMKAGDLVQSSDHTKIKGEEQDSALSIKATRNWVPVTTLYAVGPVGNEPGLLSHVTKKSFDSAAENNFQSITVPCITTGTFKSSNEQLKLLFSWSFWKSNPKPFNRIMSCLLLNLEDQFERHSRKRPSWLFRPARACLKAFLLHSAWSVFSSALVKLYNLNLFHLINQIKWNVTRQFLRIKMFWWWFCWTFY